MPRPPGGSEKLADHDESLRRLTALGDVLLRERALAKTHPADAGLVRDYVERQRRAAAAWEHTSVSATWLLRKA